MGCTLRIFRFSKTFHTHCFILTIIVGVWKVHAHHAIITVLQLKKIKSEQSDFSQGHSVKNWPVLRFKLRASKFHHGFATGRNKRWNSTLRSFQIIVCVVLVCVCVCVCVSVYLCVCMCAPSQKVRVNCVILDINFLRYPKEILNNLLSWKIELFIWVLWLVCQLDHFCVVKYFLEVVLER